MGARSIDLQIRLVTNYFSKTETNCLLTLFNLVTCLEILNRINFSSLSCVTQTQLILHTSCKKGSMPFCLQIKF